MVQAVLFDLDGVIRIYRDEDTRAIEKRFALPSGCIDSAAFTQGLLERVTTGVISRREWVAAVGNAIGCIEAAEAWEQRPVHADKHVLAIVEAVKAQGMRACLITNGTDNLRVELEGLGLLETFDAIFNSAELGCAKPAPEIFGIAIESLQLTADRVAYVDDTEANVASASRLGIQAVRYTDVSALRTWIADRGVPMHDRQAS